MGDTQNMSIQNQVKHYGLGWKMTVQKGCDEAHLSAIIFRSSREERLTFSGTMSLERTGQGDLQECWRSAQCWLTSISAAIILATSAGTESLAGVLAQCPALTHFNLKYAQIGDHSGAASLARVL
jgi:hypothetical protein